MSKTIDDELNNDWIDEYFKYNNFYKEQVENIDIVNIYLDVNKNIININKNNVYLDNPLITKEHLLYLIKQHNSNTNHKYRLLNFFKYNFDIDECDLKKYIDDDDNNDDDNDDDYLINYNIIQDIKWNDTIHSFNQLNGLYFIFQEKNTTNKKTLKNKKIYKNKNKTRKIILR
jgi:hypothetical protein